MKFEQSHSDQIEIADQREVKKAVTHLGKMDLQKGMHVFDLDMKTGYITLAEYETVANIKGGLNKKLIVKEGHLYAPAINIKNAEKKFIKML